jgi:hypothetical protein
MMKQALIYLTPYFLEVLGAILIAAPWLQDQRFRHLFDAGTELLESDQEDVARLGATLRRSGLRRLIGVDIWQIRVVKAGIALLCLSFLMRIGIAVWLPQHLLS